jgi:MerR family transcriptional regulator, light-induced transcriptional regulator
MTTFMEQIADLGGWSGHSRPGSSDRAETLAAKRLSDTVDNAKRNRGKLMLSRLVEGEIVPYLAQARGQAQAGGADAAGATTAGDTAELVRLLLTQEAAGAVAFVEQLRRRGATPDALYLGIVTQAARRLGELWDDDRCGFTEVTIGMGRLQQVLRALSPRFQMAAVRRSRSPNILLLPAPGDHHTLGLAMLAEFFQRDGWHVAGGPGCSPAAAADIARGGWIDVAGFSIGSARLLEGLAHGIQEVRRASFNRDLSVMVGGPLFHLRPGLVARVGADTAACDAREAVQQARGLLTTLQATG